TRPFSTLVANKSLVPIDPCVTLGSRLGGPRVTQAQTQSQPGPPDRAAFARSGVEAQPVRQRIMKSWVPHPLRPTKIAYTGNAHCGRKGWDILSTLQSAEGYKFISG